MFKKFKQKFKAFMTGKSGFSLVELIVVIAIMAVMAAVLAPALLGYVEKSRMQKDDSAMDEVVNAIQLSLADQEIYDEVLEHSVWDNVSCYIDKKDESQFADCKMQLKAANGDKKEQYMFGDEARLLDETVYYAAGNMRGLTITFSPLDNTETYDFANGILNKFVGRKTGILSENPELYNRLRSVIGDKLDTTSQTYRNSDYTIFIRVGSIGGAEVVQQDAIQVWGQFNGTNLTEKDHKYELSSGRVVGSAGANDEWKNTDSNSSENHENFSEIKTIIVSDVEYQYEEGMTWREWFYSDYNTTNWEIVNGSHDIFVNGQICTKSHHDPNINSSLCGVNRKVIQLTFSAILPPIDGGQVSFICSNVPLDIDTKIGQPREDIADYKSYNSKYTTYRFSCTESYSGGGIIGYNPDNPEWD